MSNYHSQTSAGGIILLIFLLIYVIAALVANWRLYSKAGVPGIFAFIPIVNIIYMAKIARVPMISLLLLFIPIVGWIFAIYLAYKFMEAYGGELGLFLLYVFLTPIAVFYIAFNDSVQYVYKDVN